MSTSVMVSIKRSKRTSCSRSSGTTVEGTRPTCLAIRSPVARHEVARQYAAPRRRKDGDAIGSASGNAVIQLDKPGTLLDRLSLSDENAIDTP